MSEIITKVMLTVEKNLTSKADKELISEVEKELISEVEKELNIEVGKELTAIVDEGSTSTIDEDSVITVDEDSTSTDKQDANVTIEESPTSTVEEKSNSWVAPTFSVSRSVELSQDTLVKNRCVSALPDGVESECYKILRTQILHRTRETGGNTVMVTSALPGEGKTITAMNLALTVAKEFKQTALLVDCDLRKQSLHKYMGFESDKGLSDFLLDDSPVQDIFVWPGIEKLTLISGGRTIHESSEMLGSQKMKELVLDMKSRYPERYIFFDTPPVLSGADALAFSAWVDSILVVVKAGETSTKDINKALNLLPKEKVLGLVLNRDESSIEPYYM